MKPNVVLAAASLLVAAILVACGGDGADEAALDAGGSESGSAQLVHVHALGLNPADNMLYVATHNGLYRLNEGVPELVGGRYWDVMGFTVRGPDNFIGGGHPSLAEIREGKYPPLLGFIETKDAGASWDILAMRGETDLHAFAIDDAGIYAIDSGSGRLLASEDGRPWESRSEISAFSLSAATGSRLLATTEDGLFVSVDGGRSWEAQAGAPPIVLVASDGGGATWGLASDGTVLRDAGKEGWRTVGTVGGPPEAFAVSVDRLFAATSEGIFESTDGATWTQVYAAPE